MTPIIIEQAGKYDGQEVTIRGWLYNMRESGKLLFPIFRDGTGIIQGVCALKESPEAFAALIFCWITGICGCARRGRRRFCGFARRRSERRASSWTARAIR